VGVVTAPDTTQWRELYEAARLFCEAKPWEVLPEDQLVAVELPGGGDVLYCSTLGSSGGQRGLIAARGARGLISYVLLSMGELDEDEAPVEQDALSFLLGDEQLLSDEDHNLQSQLGLTFDDDTGRPLFRSLKPHYLGIRPDATEAASLTTALEQVRLVAQEIRDGTPAPGVNDEEEVIARRKDEQGAWQTGVVTLPSPPDSPRLEADPLRCALVLRRGRRSREVWEATITTLGSVEAEDGGEAFWARLLLCVDRDSKQIAGGEVLAPDVSPQHALLSAIEKGGTIPRTLDVTSGLLESQLKPLADVLKIRLRRVEELRVAGAVRRQMKQALLSA
jgi:hypothetical protein